MPSPHHGGAPLHANAPTPHEGHAASGRPGSRTTRYASAPPPHGARQEPIHGASHLVSLATAVSHPAESLSAAPRASCPTGHGPRPPPPGAYPQHLAHRAHRPQPLGRPARSLSTAPRASCPRPHSHQPSPRSLSTAPRALCPRPPHPARIRMRPVCTLTQPWLQASPRATLTAPCSHRMQPYCTLAKLCCRPRLAPP